jgi:hypothetical protein
MATAMLDATSAQDALAQYPLLQLAAAFRSTRIAADSASHAGDEAEPQSSSRIRIQGSVHVTMRCPGELGTPVYDPTTNGSVSMTVAVANSRILQSIGGEAVACKLRGSLINNDIRVGLDGPINFDLGRDLGLGEGWSGVLLVDLTKGVLSINDTPYRNLSAQFSDNSFQTFATVATGLAFLQLAGDGISVFGGNGTWRCPDPESCALQ